MRLKKKIHLRVYMSSFDIFRTTKSNSPLLAKCHAKETKKKIKIKTAFYLYIKCPCET